MSDNVIIAVIGFVQALLVIVLAVLGWSLRSIFADVKKAIADLQETLEEMTEKFFEHQLVDAATHEKIIAIQKNLENHTGRLDRHSGKIDELEKKIITLK